MVVVTIELWPRGNQKKSKLLGILTMTNDGTGTSKIGNYKVAKTGPKGGGFKAAEVKGFNRNHPVWELLLRSLRELL